MKIKLKNSLYVLGYSLINFGSVCTKVSELLFGNFFVILLGIALPIKSPVVSAAF